VIDAVEEWRQVHEHPTNTNVRLMLTFNRRVSQRDAEYIVECVRLLLVVVQAMALSLDDYEISDEAIEVFGRFLSETSQLHTLFLWELPPRQIRRLLDSLHTNRSVKKLFVRKLQDNEGALWFADLLRRKTNFTELRLYHCRFPFTQILPLLRGQPNLKALAFVDGCCSSSNYDRLLLFNDPEFTQLFVDNLLLSPSTTLKGLWVEDCGMLVHSRPLTNRPSMAGFHKNTTLIELRGGHDDTTSLFIEPILRRNRYLGYVHDMLGTRMTTMLPTSSFPAVTSLTLPPAIAGKKKIVIAPTIPPPCDSLWATVLAKVGQGTQGATPVFTILHDRLATWMEP
jgi:hypothetical protein